MTRSKALLLGLSLLLPLVAGEARAEKSGGCRVATKGNSPVAKACREGGRAAAKKVMKDAVKAANKNGGDFKCGGCHESTRTFALKDNAKGDFTKLLAAASK